MAWPDTVRKTDLEIDWFSGTGGGGQYRNKHPNCCRMKHIPTGITVTAQDQRSRQQNQRTAFKRLCDKLVPIMKREVQKKRYAAGEERIRNYHQPEDRVTDKRVPGKRWSYEEVVNGKALADIIKAIRLDGV